MDDLDTDSGTQTWALSRLGYGIDALIDREINKPTAIANSGAYGIDNQGRIYTVGQPLPAATVAPRQPINTTLVLLVLAAVYLAMNK
jgi:hypothetical protein